MVLIWFDSRALAFAASALSPVNRCGTSGLRAAPNTSFVAVRDRRQRDQPGIEQLALLTIVPDDLDRFAHPDAVRIGAERFDRHLVDDAAAQPIEVGAADVARPRALGEGAGDHLAERETGRHPDAVLGLRRVFLIAKPDRRACRRPPTAGAPAAAAR